MMRKLMAAVAAIVIAIGLVAPVGAAQPHPDTACMRAGMATLKSVGLFQDVARSGISIGAAVGYGVTVRPGADISGVPNPIPLSLLLADHRAGANSLFVYPWCS